MSISRDDAARALREAEAAADRSATAAGYQRASGFLILWGFVWLAGNLAAFLRMPYGNVAFPALMLIGIAGSIALGLRVGRDMRQSHSAPRALVVAAAFALFSYGLGVVLPGLSLMDAEALICLAIGAGYMIMGVSIGWRMTVVGAALLATVILGTLYARDQFFLWLALAGGGGLILGGLWMRRV